MRTHKIEFTTLEIIAVTGSILWILSNDKAVDEAHKKALESAFRVLRAAAAKAALH